jgi:hypothetical protein
MEKPFHGMRYGCNDTGAPERYSLDQLSRLTDAMYAAQQAGINPKEVFNLAPAMMRLEWNYSNWYYVDPLTIEAVEEAAMRKDIDTQNPCGPRPE